jgi:hypothetical protein
LPSATVIFSPPAGIWMVTGLASGMRCLLLKQRQC